MELAPLQGNDSTGQRSDAPLSLASRCLRKSESLSNQRLVRPRPCASESLGKNPRPHVPCMSMTEHELTRPVGAEEPFATGLGGPVTDIAEPKFFCRR